jgi:hypothetical protein
MLNLFSLSLVLFSALSFAEQQPLTTASESSEGQIRLGLKAGVNLSGINQSSELLYNRGGMVGGVVINIPVDEHFSFQGELSYTQYGWRFFLSQGTVPNDAVGLYQSSYDTLESQLLGKYTFSDGPQKPFLILGLVPAFRLSSKISHLSNSYNGKIQPETDLSSSTNSFLLSAAFGGGLMFRIGDSTDLAVDFRYLMGLTKLSKTEDIKSKALYMGLSLLF